MKRMVIAISLLCQGAYVAAQQPPGAGDYFLALGKMLANIRAVQYTVDICSEQYPATKADNNRALAQWHQRNHEIIADVTKRFEGLPDRWAKLDAQSAKDGPENWRKINSMLDGIRGQLKQQYDRELGPEKFVQVCEAYPLALGSHDLDLEHAHAKEIGIIQRGPKY